RQSWAIWMRIEITVQRFVNFNLDLLRNLVRYFDIDMAEITDARYPPQCEQRLTQTTQLAADQRTVHRAHLLQPLQRFDQHRPPPPTSVTICQSFRSRITSWRSSSVFAFSFRPV